jgi:hypothetical protein
VFVNAASLLLFSRDPRTESPCARPHGRVDAAVTLTRTLVVMAAAFVDDMPATLFIAVVCVANVAQLYGYCFYLPYFLQPMNQLQVACASVVVWASLCMAMAQIRDAPQVRVRGPGIQLLSRGRVTWPVVVACSDTACRRCTITSWATDSHRALCRARRVVSRATSSLSRCR